MKTVCFGSMNLDYTYQMDHMVRKGETQQSLHLQIFPGGKGLNQAIALKRAGADVSMAGCIGKDGDLLINTLKEAGINADNVCILDDQPTGHAIIQVDRSHDNCIITYGGANHAINQRLIDGVLSKMEKGDLLVLQNEISMIPQICKQAKEAGIRTAFTPAPVNTSLIDVPIGELDFLLCNEKEAAAISGLPDESSREEILKKLRLIAPQTTLIVTFGAYGALYIDTDEQFFQPAFPVSVKDTTAAGDTFAGYVLAGLQEGLSARQAMDLAARAAALCVSRPGASPSIPTRAEAESFTEL